MYKKIRFKLTLLFTGIAGFILAVMSVFYLYTAEKELKHTRFLSFCTEVNTMISNLEQQRTVTYEWIAKTVATNLYTIAIYDKDVPLTYTATILSETQKALALEFLENCQITESSGSEFISPHTEMCYTASDGSSYYVSVAALHNGNIRTVIYSPMSTLYTQINNQRLRMLFINLLGFCLLFLFSYFFTGKLLAPIDASQKKQSEFIAAVSHELRTPLAVILSSIQAAKDAPLEEKQILYHTIEKESRRMSLLVGDMLTLAGADSHTWNFEMKEVELDTLLLDAYEAFLPLALEKKVSLEISLPEESIPYCTCDANRMMQLFEILISNALTYGGNQIRLSLDFNPPYFYLIVADNGPGIPPHMSERIFDRFYRGEDSRSTKEHFGLGLSIAREIVIAHHGTIEVTETDGGGCTFVVRV